MKTVLATIEGVSPYSQSRFYEVEKLNEGKELPEDYKDRTWRNHLHTNEAGEVYIPPMAFKNCMSSAAKYRGEQIPGKGKRTWTKIFESGLMVMDYVYLGIKAEDVKSETLFLPSDGIRGSGKRVKKTYPVIHKWSCSVTFYVLDELITQDVFKSHIETAGRLIGIGRFRPEKNGFYGRFDVKKIAWQ